MIWLRRLKSQEVSIGRLLDEAENWGCSLVFRDGAAFAVLAMPLSAMEISGYRDVSPNLVAVTFMVYTPAGYERIIDCRWLKQADHEAGYDCFLAWARRMISPAPSYWEGDPPEPEVVTW